MTEKTREEVTKDIMDVDFKDTSKFKYIDDEGYEDGKSKNRELIEEALKEGDPKDFMFKRGMKMLMEK